MSITHVWLHALIVHGDHHGIVSIEIKADSVLRNVPHALNVHLLYGRLGHTLYGYYQLVIFWHHIWCKFMPRGSESKITMRAFFSAPPMS
jgi:hypothetical protein